MVACRGLYYGNIEPRDVIAAAALAAGYARNSHVQLS